jgi:hypothetical protein
MSMSDYLEEKLLNHVLHNTAYTTPGTSLYMALFTADPTDTGSYTNELANANAYARQQVTFAAASNPGGTITTSADITFPVCTTTNWGTITHAAICDSGTRGAGNMLVSGQLDASKTINVGDQFKILAGNFTVTLD